VKKILAALTLAFLCTAGYGAARGNFYLIAGPEFIGTPAPYSGVFKGDIFFPKSISAVLARGEGFDGRWIYTSPGKKRFSDPRTDPPQPKLATAWDSVYGPGFFTAHVLGAPFFARAEITGSKGTVLQIEIYRREFDRYDDSLRYSPLNLQGVAQDNKGNIYKVVF
jgi:hypothetical protein